MVRHRFRIRPFNAWDVAMFFLFAGMAVGTIVSVLSGESTGIEKLGKKLLSENSGISVKIAEMGVGRILSLWGQRGGTVFLLWLAGMSPMAFPVSWGFCGVLGAEIAFLVSVFTSVVGVWGLFLFGMTLVPQIFLYIPVILILLSWAFSQEKRVRLAGFFVLLLLAGIGALMEVCLSPRLIAFLFSHVLMVG